MYKIPTIVIQFNNEIEPQAIPFFRGAVIASKAAVMGVGKGIEAISQLLSAGDFHYQIGNEKVGMQIQAVNAYDNEIVLTENADNRYRIQNWLPLNTDNYKQYQETDNMVDRIHILERVLIGNILSFLKGVGIHMEDQIVLSITNITNQHAVTYKNVKLMGFDIEFKTNITFPQYIGIGKNASVGCGIITKATI